MYVLRTIALALLAGTGAIDAAAAQQPGVAPVALSRDERESLATLQTAIQARNYPAAAAALEPARARARSGYARYLVASLQLRLALDTNDAAQQARAIDAMIDSGGASAAELPTLYKNQAVLLQNARKAKEAEAAFSRWAEAAPGDPAAIANLAEIKEDGRKYGEAVPLLERAIAMRKASGQIVPEGWYKRLLKLSFDDAKLGPQSLRSGRDLVATYPTATNWRDAMLVYRNLNPTDPAGALDSMRLARAAKALAGERDYLELAQALSTGGMPAEAKAVLEEGIAAKMVDPAKPAYKELLVAAGKRAAAERALLSSRQVKALAASTGVEALRVADARLSYGHYADAGALYRAALQKGGIDAGLAQNRLGIALAMAGQRAEAEAALRAVTGARAELAAYWLVWIAQRG